MTKLYVSLLLLAISLATASGCTLSPTKPEEPVTIGEVVKEIDKALVEVQRQLLSDQEMHAKDKSPSVLLPFESAEVELETTTAVEEGATFKLIVITIGTTASRATAQTVSFKLTPPSLEKRADREQRAAAQGARKGDRCRLTRVASRFAQPQESGVARSLRVNQVRGIQDTGKRRNWHRHRQRDDRRLTRKDEGICPYHHAELRQGR